MLKEILKKEVDAYNKVVGFTKKVARDKNPRPCLPLKP
jgi:hypothetical protein